jgi:hypothetical protein
MALFASTTNLEERNKEYIKVTPNQGGEKNTWRV